MLGTGPAVKGSVGWYSSRQTYIEEEEDADWPHGCYEIAAGLLAAVNTRKMSKDEYSTQ